MPRRRKFARATAESLMTMPLTLPLIHRSLKRTLTSARPEQGEVLAHACFRRRPKIEHACMGDELSEIWVGASRRWGWPLTFISHELAPCADIPLRALRPFA